MLLKTIEEVKEFLSISTSVKFTTLKSVLDVVENEFLRPVLGEAMYAELCEYYESLPIATPNDAQHASAKLLKLAQGSLVHLAYWYGFDILNSYIEEGGIRKLDSTSAKGLYKYQEENLKDFFKNAGFNRLDVMLEYLDGEDKVYFAEFHNSETGKQLKGLFIPSTEVFNDTYFIGRSRLTFMRLKPYQPVVLDMHIRPLLGAANYDLILAEMVKDLPAGNVDEDGKMLIKVRDIMPMIRKPIAYFATAMLMEESGADLGDKGLYFEGRSGNTMSDTMKLPATASRILQLVERNKGLGESYLNILRNYMLQHAADWNGFTAPKSGRVNRNNDGKKTFWA